MLLISFAYVSLFVLAWNFDFPTKIERTLWRIASLIQPGSVIVFWAISEFGFNTYPKLRTKFEQIFSVSQHQHPDDGGPKNKSTITKKFQHIAATLRNNSPHKDPAVDVPLKAILPIYVLGFVYCHARTFLLLEDIIELRSLPASAYLTVNWSAFIPHI
jgi:hypothetical protein